MSYITKETKGAEGGPLFFTFHGTGGDETQFHTFAQDLIPDAHVISPRGDVSEHGANRYFRRTGEGVYDMDDLAIRTDAMAAFLSDAKARVKADRVIGLGYSNGANILASVAFARPEIFTDLVLMHPLVPWDPGRVPGLSATRVLVTAGKSDPICPEPMTQSLIGWFEAQGTPVEHLMHPGGHEIAKPEIAAIQAFLG